MSSVYIHCFVMFSLLFCFFFLMIRRPPRSTLFPYRRSSDLLVDEAMISAVSGLLGTVMTARVYCNTISLRSEEHTSELQSHSDLVCRLLLEKKKKKKKHL